MKKSIVLVAFLLSTVCLFAQKHQHSEIDPEIEKTTFTYAEKDSSVLKLDKYRLKNTTDTQACVFFVFGGGFKNGERDDQGYNDYFNFLTKEGFTVISIDYRLGMKGQKNVGVTNYKPIKNAIDLAVEDLYDATSFAVAHAKDWKIDTSTFIVTGSSAGAITVLQAEYENRNHYVSAQRLPVGFQYAGVISFAGAIFSTNGELSWKENRPCPIMLFHGDEDKTVVYNKIRFFKLGFFGSKHIASKLQKKGFPYWFSSFKYARHEISSSPMYKNQEDILRFIRTFVINKQNLQVDIQINELDKKRSQKKESYKDLYK